MSDRVSPDHEGQSGNRQMSEARVDFEPSWELNELLASFLHADAYRKLGVRSLSLSLDQKPVLFETADDAAVEEIMEYDRTLRNRPDGSLYIAKRLDYDVVPHPSKQSEQLTISMRLGGSALASLVATEPFFTERRALHAVARLDLKNVLRPREFHQQRRHVNRQLKESSAANELYASEDYRVVHPRVTMSPRGDFRAAT